jgi:ribose transport system substrate-binding protein
MMAIGALKYLQESKKTFVKVAGYDALSEAMAEVKAGRMAATIDQQAAEQGYQGIAVAVKLIQGATVAPVTVIDTRLVTAANLQ